MANEMAFTAGGSVTKGSFTITVPSQSIKVDQATQGAWMPIVSVGTSEEDMAPVDIATLGWVFLKNLDTTNYVTWGAKDTTMKAIGRLKAGEFALFRMEPGVTLRWQANTAACNVLVMLFNA